MHSVGDALETMASVILFGLGTILLLYVWVIDGIVLQAGIRSGSWMIAATYGGLLVLELTALISAIFVRRGSTGPARWGRGLCLAKLIWLFSVVNFLTFISMGWI